jgi:hypothetical protein
MDAPARLLDGIGLTSKAASEGPFASNALVAGARFGNYVPPCPVGSGVSAA